MPTLACAAGFDPTSCDAASASTYPSMEGDDLIYTGASVKIASSVSHCLIDHPHLSPSHKRQQVADVAVIVNAQAEEGRDCEQMGNSGLLTIYKREVKCTEAEEGQA